MKHTTIFGGKEILHNLPYEAITVTVDKATTGTETVAGRKILKAGALLAGDGASVFADRSKKVKTAEATAPILDGILLYDVDVTDGDAEAALVYRGTVDAKKVTGYQDEVADKLKHIQFVKGV